MSRSRVSQTRPRATRTVVPRRAAMLIDWLREICRAVSMGRHGAGRGAAAPEAAVPGQEKKRGGIPGLLSRSYLAGFAPRPASRARTIACERFSTWILSKMWVMLL